MFKKQPCWDQSDTRRHTHKGTHVICAMPSKVPAGTHVMPRSPRSRDPPCVGQEPVRTTAEPTQVLGNFSQPTASPLNVQPPNTTSQGAAETPAVISTAKRMNGFFIFIYLASESHHSVNSIDMTRAPRRVQVVVRLFIGTQNRLVALHSALFPRLT